MTQTDPTPDAADQAVVTAEAADAAEDVSAAAPVAAPAAPTEAPPAPVVDPTAPVPSTDPSVTPAPTVVPPPAAPVVPPAKTPFKAASYTTADGTTVQAHLYDTTPANVLEFAEWVGPDNLSVLNDQLVIHIGDQPVVVLPDTWVISASGTYTVANETAFQNAYTVVPG